MKKDILTYWQLLEELKTLTEEQLDMNITVYDKYKDEYFQAILKYTDETEVLNKNHPITTQL